MDPMVFIKQPWEERTLEFDFTDALSTGDSLASISGVTVWNGSTETTLTMLEGTPSITGAKVYAKIVGGTAGTDYWVRVRVITTNADQIEDDLKVLVRQTGV